MSRIEDIFYEAHEIGLRELLFKEIDENKIKKKYIHKSFDYICEDVFLKLKNKLNEKSGKI